MQKIKKNKFFESIKPYILTYLLSIALPLLVGLFSALLTKDNMTVYSELTKPPLAPPAWIFPIVWTILYTLMGISSATAIISRTDENTKCLKKGLEFYALSLVLNFGWSIIFFNFQAYFSALVWLGLLIYMVVKTVLCYWDVSRLAAVLQIPYIIWLAFAFYLNAFYAFML